MRDGISGAELASKHEYAAIVNQLAIGAGVAPLLVYAIRLNETSEGFPPDGLQGGADPKTGLMPDGSNAGHGVMQLTSSWPSDWEDPAANIGYAIEHFIAPAWKDWVGIFAIKGDDLIRCIAASYNAGFDAARKAHIAGDVDAVTTDRYGDRALEHFHALLAELPADPTAFHAGPILAELNGAPIGAGSRAQDAPASPEWLAGPWES